MLPIKGIADSFPFSNEDNSKSHSADGSTKERVVVLMEQVA